MSAILSKPVPAFDISSANFRAAARDLGEVMAILSGGIAPSPECRARLLASLRGTQGFLMSEAKEQLWREDISDDQALVAAVRQAAKPISLAGMPVMEVQDA